MYRIDHWIDGRAVASKSGRSGKVFDPATGQVQGEVGFADVSEVDTAVATRRRDPGRPRTLTVHKHGNERLNLARLQARPLD